MEIPQLALSPLLPMKTILDGLILITRMPMTVRTPMPQMLARQQPLVIKHSDLLDLLAIPLTTYWCALTGIPILLPIKNDLAWKSRGMEARRGRRKNIPISLTAAVQRPLIAMYREVLMDGAVHSSREILPMRISACVLPRIRGAFQLIITLTMWAWTCITR